MLPNGALESFWDDLWLGIRPFPNEIYNKLGTQHQARPFGQSHILSSFAYKMKEKLRNATDTRPFGQGKYIPSAKPSPHHQNQPPRPLRAAEDLDTSWCQSSGIVVANPSYTTVPIERWAMYKTTQERDASPVDARDSPRMSQD